MTGFLEQLTDNLLNKFNHDLSDLCLVFPSRRAGLYFKKIYASKISRPAWSPAIFSIEDFIAEFSDLQVADELDLVFHLFEVYKKYFPEESFEQFYPWGVMLLSDFSDADANLADTSQLFSTIRDMHEIEDRFDLEDEDKKRIADFWEAFFGRKVEKEQDLRKSFFHYWQHLGTIYQDYRNRLLTHRMAYAGLAARHVAEASATLNSSYGHVVFAGFNALSKAEEKIIEIFVKSGKGSVYYDADEYYINDKKQEAGNFLRKKFAKRLEGASLKTSPYRHSERILLQSSTNIKQDAFSMTESFGLPEFLGNDLSQSSKEIQSIGVPLQSLQAKVAGQILSTLQSQTPNPKPETNIAVVLPDEQLLLPLLYSLPDSIPDINVTMGYPGQFSPMYRLLEAIFELQRSFRNTPPSYHAKNVLSLLNHSYLQQLFPAEIKQWKENHLNELSFRIPQEDLLKSTHPLFHLLFSPVTSGEEYLSFFHRFFALLINTIRTTIDGLPAMAREHILFFYSRFRKMDEILKKYAGAISSDFFKNLFREVIHSSKIPFSGEPLKGIQIMGLLETRLLDFDNVIILSMNEGVMPSASQRPSFIPYNLRKAFGLPVSEDNSAIMAYHFYRLLQRAKNVHLLYNTEVKSILGGEKSRFILQVENELVKKNPSVRYSSRLVDIPLNETSATPYTVIKDAGVMAKLKEFSGNGRQPLSFAKKFSPSSLSNYINCKLQFYLQYIAKLREPEEAEEVMEGRLFGTILHETMRLLYESYPVIEKKDFNEIEKHIETVIDRCIGEHFTAADTLDGKNILMRRVMIELISSIVEFDKRHAPLKIESLEKEIGLQIKLDSGQTALLYGKIDRVDKIDGHHRVVDYKTGRGDKENAKTISELFENPDRKEQFQAFFYSWLLKRNNIAPLKAGLFRMRALSKGIDYINGGEMISDEQHDEFETHLKSMLEEIFNPEIPFSQTEEVERCIYCNFKDICNR